MKSKILCKECERKVSELINDLETQAKKQKRGTLISDAISDVKTAITDGSIGKIIERDRKYSQGLRVGRKIK